MLAVSEGLQNVSRHALHLTLRARYGARRPDGSRLSALHTATLQLTTDRWVS
jgi:hypothetical protein